MDDISSQTCRDRRCKAIAAQVVSMADAMPAICPSAGGGFVAGPATAFLDPAADFARSNRRWCRLPVANHPCLKAADAEISRNSGDNRPPVRRIIMYQAPLTWGMAALAAQFTLAD